MIWPRISGAMSGSGFVATGARPPGHSGRLAIICGRFVAGPGHWDPRELTGACSLCVVCAWLRGEGVGTGVTGGPDLERKFP